MGGTLPTPRRRTRAGHQHQSHKRSRDNESSNDTGQQVGERTQPDSLILPKARGNIFNEPSTGTEEVASTTSGADNQHSNELEEELSDSEDSFLGNADARFCSALWLLAASLP